MRVALVIPLVLIGQALGLGIQWGFVAYYPVGEVGVKCSAELGDRVVVVARLGARDVLQVLDGGSGRLLNMTYVNTTASCAVAGDVLYVVENRYFAWSLAAYGPSLNPLARVDINPGVSPEASVAIVADSRLGVYIIATWIGHVYIERRDASNLTILATLKLDNCSVRSAGINPATGDLWLVGASHEPIIEISNGRGYFTTGISRWCVVAASWNLGEYRRIDLGLFGEARGLAFDEEGNVYIVGDGMAKLRPDGGVWELRYVDGDVVIYRAGRVYVINKRTGLYIVFDRWLREIGGGWVLNGLALATVVPGRRALTPLQIATGSTTYLHCRKMPPASYASWER
ncbi:MAG: hypothetical protein QW434_09670 [Pyrobaculum sp.]